MTENRCYHYEPTGTGCRISSANVTDPRRQMPCVLYPDNRRDRIFNAQQMEKMDRFPFRPIVCAKLVPEYILDLHSASGSAGYGRFAVSCGDDTLWLDALEHVETEYSGGEVNYTLWDSAFYNGAKIRVTFAASKGACGIVIRCDCTELPMEATVYYLHGGMMGTLPSSPTNIPFERDMCAMNAVAVQGDVARITMEDIPCQMTYENLQLRNWRTSEKGAWRTLEGWIRTVAVRVPSGTIRIASPDSLISFQPDELQNVESAMGGIVCGILRGGQVHYLAAGLGDEIEKQDLQKVLETLRQENQKIAERFTVSSGNAAFDGAVRVNAFHTNALFGDNIFLHGNLSWRDGYPGWRQGFGPLVYGMFEQARTHFENHVTKTRITEGPDKGGFCPVIESGTADGTVFYNMHQTFFHQLRRYWEYTGDRAFADRMLPVLEASIQRDLNRLRFGEEMLIENCLNTWISDSHWTVEGQCGQASSYLYNITDLVSEMTEDPEKKAYYRNMADTIRRDMNKVLWMPEKGVFAYAQDLRGNKLLHDEPELADIYHSTELGTADPIQTYQMLDWAEANLRQELTDNGGRLFWSANWHPNSGDTYTHSTYELSLSEVLNLALAYYQIGLTEQAYEIFRASYMALYGGRDPQIPDQDYEVLLAQGFLPLYTNMVMDLPCQVSTNGTPRRNVLFGDTIGLFGRTIYEGILGVRPLLQKNEIWLTPCIPEDLPKVEMHSALLDYTYEKVENGVQLHYCAKKVDCKVGLLFTLPPAEIKEVYVNGQPVAYKILPYFGCIRVLAEVENAAEGTVVVSYRKANILPVEERKSLSGGDRLQRVYTEETIVEVIDPQNRLTDVTVEGGSFAANVGGCPGSGVFFLKMRIGETEYLRPVKIWIKKEENIQVFRNHTQIYEAPYHWKTINMDEAFNASSPKNAVELVFHDPYVPTNPHHQTSYDYFKMHYDMYMACNPQHGFHMDRWLSMVDENDTVMTGEGVPFRSHKRGDIMAVTSLIGKTCPEQVAVPVNDSGRAAYLLITGVTFPMQSHVENLRITFTYEDGVEEAYPLVSPFAIGDMWFGKWGRYHDTPANGFENLSGINGAMSSNGLDLTKPILSDLEAHILHFPLRQDCALKSVQMRTIANDIVFALMGITLLK